ncbi:MAG: tetratricopeptide repeat protein, partial [Halothece sp. Uz-M2-17]|nr:tetratricopeptide repeat protein [Halothece sp. Uz-M2-17]
QECLHLAQKLAQQNKLQPAITCYQKALALDPQLIEASQALADLLLRQGRTGEAIKYYRQFLEQKPDSTVTWQSLGKALMAFGQREEAEACYRQAEWLLMQPDQTSSSQELSHASSDHTEMEQAIVTQQKAETALQDGKPDVALQQYREAFAYLTGQKEVPQGQVQIFLFSETEAGQLLLNNSDQQSLASLTRLTLIANAFPTFTKGLSWCLEGLAKLKGKNVPQGSPKKVWNREEKMLDAVGHLSSQESSPEEAGASAKQSQQSATFSSESFSDLEQRARACLDAGDLERCVVICQTLVEQDPQWGEGYKRLGQAYHRKGDLSLALEAYRKAVALELKDIEVFLWSGEILVSQQQWWDAIAQYRKALQYAPQSWNLYHHLGDALQAVGDTDGAIAAYEKAVELAH